MKSSIRTLALSLGVMAILPLSAHATSPDEQRGAIQDMEHHVLDHLVRDYPQAKSDLDSSIGYAVFSSGSLAVVWVSGGYGHGVAHDNRSNRDTYMEMALGGVGLGLGAKDYQTVFVFHDRKAFHDFITTGLDLSGSADAAAKVEQKGGSFSGGADVLPGVRVYQLTKTGLMAQAMLQGTKYWTDDDLNRGDTATTSETTYNNGYAPASGGSVTTTTTRSTTTYPAGNQSAPHYND